MTIKCIIIDDEPLAIDVIAEHVERTPFLTLVESFTHPVKAFEFLMENKIDTLFIDIEMPDLSGIDLVNKLNYKPVVIFTTAYDQYAIEGFKLDAIDYLLKPVDYPDFLKAAEKARKWLSANNKALNIKSDKQFLFIKSEYKIIRIELNSILYIQGMSEYVRIHRENGKPIMSLLSLKSIEKQLVENDFMRVHKSYIVNLQKITEIENNCIICANDELIPVSKQYKEQFQVFLKRNFLI